MKDQTIRELDEAIRLNPQDAKAYLNRGYAYAEKGNYDQAIEDFDDAVRLCTNYETDFIDSEFAHGGKLLVEKAIAVLESRINVSLETAVDFYYTGVRALFFNDMVTARRVFERALKLGYDDREKVEQHLENLKKR